MLEVSSITTALIYDSCLIRITMLLRPSEEYNTSLILTLFYVSRLQVTSLLRLPFQSVCESNRYSDNVDSKCQEFVVRRGKIRNAVSLRVLPLSVCHGYVISNFVFKRPAFRPALGAKSFFYFFFFRSISVSVAFKVDLKKSYCLSDPIYYVL